MVTTAPLLTLTPAAVAQLQRLLAEEANPNLALRVYVAPGGCSGMSYGMSLEDQSDDSDYLIEIEGLKVIVDEFSSTFISGSEIDYVNSLMGAGFTVRNPNAKKSCACGQSFDTGNNAASARPCH